MFQKSIKTVDGQMTIRVPEILNELSVGQLIQLQALLGTAMNDLHVISICSGISLDELYNVCQLDDLNIFIDPMLKMLDQLEHSYDGTLIPATVSFKIPVEESANTRRRNFIRSIKNPTPGFKTVKVDVINNLEVEPAGAFMNARDIIADEINSHIKTHGEENWAENFKPSLESACKVLGHYFYCKVYKGPYDEQKADAFCEVVKKLSVSEALPIAAFFFMNYPNLSSTKMSFWRRVQQYSKKRRAYKRLKNSGSSIR